MKRTQIAALTALVLFGLLVGWLAMRNPQAPKTPSDEDHSRLMSAEDCLVCHGPDGAVPQSDTHPVRRDCVDCHGWR